jgi:hypothetical protein
MDYIIKNMSRSVPVHVYYDNARHEILAQKESTLRELLFDLDIPDIIVFSGNLKESYTPLVDLDKTLVDYNMWFLDGYVAELTVYKETDNYNKELYEMYLAFSR